MASAACHVWLDNRCEQAQLRNRHTNVRAAHLPALPAFPDWLSCLIQSRADRYLNHCRFWVRHAAAPEDYTLEHLAVAEWQLAAREVSRRRATGG